MSLFLRFRFGPFVSYQRVGRTSAQKRAAAKKWEDRSLQRERERRAYDYTGTVTAVGNGTITLYTEPSDPVNFPSLGFHTTFHVRNAADFTPGQRVAYRKRVHDQALLSIKAA